MSEFFFFAFGAPVSVCMQMINRHRKYGQLHPSVCSDYILMLKNFANTASSVNIHFGLFALALIHIAAEPSYVVHLPDACRDLQCHGRFMINHWLNSPNSIWLNLPRSQCFGKPKNCLQ